MIVIIGQKKLEFKIKSHDAVVERDLRHIGYLLTSKQAKYYLYKYQYIKNYLPYIYRIDGGFTRHHKPA
jgi:hypothetical protein